MYYYEYWYIFRKPIFKCAVYSQQVGYLPAFIRQGILTLIPKGKKEHHTEHNIINAVYSEILQKQHLKIVFFNRGQGGISI